MPFYRHYKVFFFIQLSNSRVYQDRKRLERERIVEYMKANPHITAKEIAKMENVSLSGINYRIKRLKKDGRIYYQGRGGRNQTGQWIVCEGGEEK